MILLISVALAFGFIALVALITLYRFLTWRYSVLNAIPGPIKDLTFRNWLMGVFFEIENEDFMVPAQRWWKEAGDQIQLMHYSGLFGRQFVMVLDPDGVKQLLTSPSHEDPMFPKGFVYLRRVLGEGLVTLDGKSWNRHRRIIQPAFGVNFVKNTLDAAVPDLVAELITYWKSNPDTDIDVSSHMSALTLDIIGKVAFSHEFDGLKSVQKWSTDPNSSVELSNPIIDGLHASLTPSATRMLLFNFRMSNLERFFIPKLHKAHVTFDEATDAVVEHAQLQSKLNGGAKSLLEIMCTDSSHGKFTRKELRDEVKTFLIAGHETTSNLCTWAFYCLTKYPHVQKLLFDEIMKAHQSEENMSVDTVDKIEYLDCFLKEVLRMYPPVGVTLRLASKNTSLLGDKIPAGTRIVIPVWLLQRHHQYWTNPLKFEPERWSKTAKPDPKFHHFAYFPFSAGGRNCIGQRFAMYEAKLIMSILIREFEFTLSPSMEGKELKLSSFVTLRCTPPIAIRAIRRSGQ